MGKIDNLRSPVVQIQVADSVQRIFACLINKNIMVWQHVTLELLQVVTDPNYYRPVDSLGALCFVSDKSFLYSAGNKITSWSLERSAEGVEDGEDEDQIAVLYNSLFNQVLVVKSLGTLKVYHAEVC
jgi:hypothetical protein